MSDSIDGSSLFETFYDFSCFKFNFSISRQVKDTTKTANLDFGLLDNS